MKVTAIRTHSFAGKNRKSGDVYEIKKQSDADLMIRAGLISIDQSNEIQQPEVARTRRRYNTRNMTAAQ